MRKWSIFSLLFLCIIVLTACGQSAEKEQVSETASTSFLLYKEQYQDDQEGLRSGDLYIQKYGQKEPEKLASDVMDEGYIYNLEKDYVIYTSRDKELFKVSAGKEKEKLADDVSAFEPIDKENVVFYQDHDANLYLVDLNDSEPEVEKIDSEISQYQLKNQSVYYVDSNQDFKVYDLKTQEEKDIAEDIQTFKFKGDEIFYTNEDGMLFYKENADKDSIKITGDYVELYRTDKLDDIVYFVVNDEEVLTLKTGNLKGETEKISEGILNYKLHDKTLYYLTEDGNLFEKATNTSTPKKLETDIIDFSFHSGELYVKDKERTVYRLKDDTKDEIGTRVVDFYISKTGEVVHLDEKQNLYIEGEKFDTGIQNLSASDDKIAFSTDRRELFYISFYEEGPKLVTDQLDQYTTVKYLNQEVYRTKLSFADITGYWQGDSTYLQIKENGEIENLYDVTSETFEINNDTRDTYSFEAKDSYSNEYNFLLEGDTLTIRSLENDSETTFTKTTKFAAEEATADYQQEQKEQEKAEEEAAKQEAEEEIDTLIYDYINYFSEMMNTGNTEYLSDYMDINSSIYDKQKEYIESSYEKGIEVEKNSADITTRNELDSGAYTVSVEENFTIYKEDEESDEKEYTNVYTVEKVDGDWLITDLQ